MDLPSWKLFEVVQEFAYLVNSAVSKASHPRSESLEQTQPAHVNPANRFLRVGSAAMTPEPHRHNDG